jgi:hypothetical protein
MSIKKVLGTITIVCVLSIATPIHVDAEQLHAAEIPLQLAWPHVVNGSGEYASIQPAFEEQAEWRVLSGGSNIVQFIGWGQAAMQMQHYLANTGETIPVDPLQMMAVLPGWSEEVQTEYLQLLQQACERLVQEPGGGRYTVVAQSDWLPARVTRQENPDWHFALGSFSYKLVLKIETVTPLRAGQPNMLCASLMIYVYDRYDWDEGRGTSIAGLYLANEVIGRLHRAGLARDYDVKGVTRIDFTTVLRQPCDTCMTLSY